MKTLFFLTLGLGAATFTDGFAPTAQFCSTKKSAGALRAEEEGGFSVDGITASLQETFQTSIRIAQESQKGGAGITQILANVLAGEYDEATVQAKIQEMINSAPMVMLTWERSPSCVNAIKAMDASGFEYSTIRLDDPWDEGNPIRAEVGKMVGRSSVPMVFIGGEYVGGYDGGLATADAPGLVQLAFKGELQSKLEEAGAKRKTSALTEA